MPKAHSPWGIHSGVRSRLMSVARNRTDSSTRSQAPLAMKPMNTASAARLSRCIG